MAEIGKKILSGFRRARLVVDYRAMRADEDAGSRF
jgi:hypothetical protein